VNGVNNILAKLPQLVPIFSRIIYYITRKDTKPETKEIFANIRESEPKSPENTIPTKLGNQNITQYS